MVQASGAKIKLSAKPSVDWLLHISTKTGLISTDEEWYYSDSVHRLTNSLFRKPEGLGRLGRISYRDLVQREAISNVIELTGCSRWNSVEWLAKWVFA